VNNKNGFSVDHITRQSRMVVRSIIAFIILLLMANLGAIIDVILHPEIGYFDSEHIIVGAASAFVVGIMMAIITVYIERIEKVFRDNKQAEESLHASEERFRALFEQASDGIFYLSTDDKIVAVNESFARMHGYSVEEMQGMNLQDLDTLESLQQVPERMRRVMAGEVVEFETEHYHTDGHVFPLAVFTGLISVGGEQLIQAFHHDITERKLAEKALRESQELFSLFLRHSPIYAYIHEVTPTESRALQSSDNYQQMLGVSSRDMMGKTMSELFPPEFAAKITADDWAVIVSGQVLKLDEDFNGRNYTSIKFPIIQGDKTLLAGYTIDITERKQAEEQLRYQGTHDILTGIYNRTFFEAEFARLEHSREFPTSMIIADVDYLKVANDTRGHAVGMN
jgi:PAS domain S-box-containing protein